MQSLTKPVNSVLRNKAWISLLLFFPPAVVLGQAFIIICFDYGNCYFSPCLKASTVQKKYKWAIYIILHYLLVKESKKKQVELILIIHSIEPNVYSLHLLYWGKLKSLLEADSNLTSWRGFLERHEEPRLQLSPCLPKWQLPNLFTPNHKIIPTGPIVTLSASAQLTKTCVFSCGLPVTFLKGALPPPRQAFCFVLICFNLPI